MQGSGEKNKLEGSENSYLFFDAVICFTLRLLSPKPRCFLYDDDDDNDI